MWEEWEREVHMLGCFGKPWPNLALSCSILPPSCLILPHLGHILALSWLYLGGSLWLTFCLSGQVLLQIAKVLLPVATWEPKMVQHSPT